MRKHEYMINAWWSYAHGGTSPVFRTQNKQEWLDKIREIKEERNLGRANCRVIERPFLSVFAYATTPDGQTAMNNTVYWKRPISAKMGFPAEVNG